MASSSMTASSGDLPLLLTESAFATTETKILLDTLYKPGRPWLTETEKSIQHLHTLQPAVAP